MGQAISFITSGIYDENNGDLREKRRTNEPYHHMNQSMRDENASYAFPYNQLVVPETSKTYNHSSTHTELRQHPIFPFANMDSDRGSSVDSVTAPRHVFPSQLPCSHGRKPKQEEEGRVRVGPVAKSAWIGFYGSCHRILLVGEGDFSFAACLAMTFGSATNMISTSLDSLGFLSNNYRRAVSNIHELKSRGSTVIHNFDATKMADYCLLKGMKFDRIVFNFPHAGFFPNEARNSQIRRHQKLVTLFFANAMNMISEDGEIHVAHKSNGFHREWNLEYLASLIGLRLIEEVPLNLAGYPGYCTKYGFGGDRNFDSNPSKTYKFGLKKNVIRWD